MADQSPKENDTLPEERKTGETLVIDEAGFTNEDKAEILNHIEKIVADSRIAVTPETFKLKPRKKGVLFPILVNVFAVVLVGVGIFFFSLYFGVRQQSLTLETRRYFSAEGQLIEELKKESEQKLQEKDQEIDKIQGQLAQVDAERENLKANMETTIKTREEELRKALDEELKRERERLSKLGTSEADIQQKLKELEEQKKTEYARQLDDFRKQAQASLETKEKELLSVKGQLQDTLQKANQERSQLAEEAKKREEKMKAQFEAEKAALQEQTSEAEKRLKSMAESRDREQLVLDQILGSYSVIMDKIRSQNFAEATSGLDSLQKMLQDTSVDAFPSIAKRRSVDLSVIQSLRDLITEKTIRASVNTAPLLEASSRLDRAQAMVDNANSLLAANNTKDARDMYLRALNEIPSASAAYGALRDMDSKAQGSSLASAADSAALLMREGKPDEAMELYAKALNGISRSSSDPVLLVASGILDAYRLKAQALANDKEKALKDMQAEREKTVKDIIADKEKAVRDAQADKDKALKELQAERDRTVRDLQAELAKRNDDIARLRTSVSGLETEKGSLSEYEADLKSLKNQYAQDQQRVNSLIIMGRREDLIEARRVLMNSLNTEAGKDVFPNFVRIMETIQTALTNREKDAARNEARETALNEVVQFTQYLAGSQAVAGDAKTRIVNKAQSDPLFSAVAREIQALATSGQVAQQVSTAQYRLLGTVSSVSTKNLVIERLISLAVKPNAIIQIKRRTPSGQETIIALGKVSDVSTDKIRAQIDVVYNDSVQPAVKDIVYIEAGTN